MNPEAVEWTVRETRPLNRTALGPLKEYEPDESSDAVTGAGDK
jgi:hypothetical protein